MAFQQALLTFPSFGVRAPNTDRRLAGLVLLAEKICTLLYQTLRGRVIRWSDEI